MSLATFARAALVLGSFAVTATVAGCTAQVRQEAVGQGEEAATCQFGCGGSSNGSSSGSSSGGTTCDPDVHVLYSRAPRRSPPSTRRSPRRSARRTTMRSERSHNKGYGVVVTNHGAITHALSVNVGYSTVTLPPPQASARRATGTRWSVRSGSFTWQSGFPVYPSNCVTQGISPSRRRTHPGQCGAGSDGLLSEGRASTRSAAPARRAPGPSAEDHGHRGWPSRVPQRGAKDETRSDVAGGEIPCRRHQGS